MSSEIASRHWDVVVVGAGLGGGTLGRRLAEKGASVLFVEHGPAQPRAAIGNEDLSDADEAELRLRGYWPLPVKGNINGKVKYYPVALGSGAGGSSLFYAATLERPERWDIDDGAERPHPTGGWPVSYDAFQPYFAEVEQLFHVSGEADPLCADGPLLLTPPPLDGSDISMIEAFKKRGLHPYRVHMGLRYVSGCRMCFGRVCDRQCKMDGRSAGVMPALATGRSAVLDMCDSVILRGSGRHVSGLEVTRGGEHMLISAKRFVLSAGGFGSPRVLLASASEHWPDGCGNSSGLVGRNLMFHLLESVVVWPDKPNNFSHPAKALTFRDFYWSGGLRLGAVQSAGLDAGYGELSSALRTKLQNSPVGRIAAGAKLNSALARLMHLRLGTGKVLRAIIEDLPYINNRVRFDPNHPQQVEFDYDVPKELNDRLKTFRKLMKQRLSGQKVFFLNREPEFDLGHVCGTLRFGNDPKTSVVNAACRFHDIDNLYTADASFFPTSTGINPSLLIAANALRVADGILADLKLEAHTAA